MIVKFLEQRINDFLIPSFTLSEGEIVIIQVPNGPFFYELEMKLVEILTGKITNDKVKINTNLKFAEHIKENRFERWFFPLTVGRYLKKSANKLNLVYKRIYDMDWITSRTQIQELGGFPRKIVTLYATLSWTNKIIFDLVGIGPQGGQDIYAIVKGIINDGGAAILIDSYNEFKHDCTTFVVAKYLGDIQ